MPKKLFQSKFLALSLIFSFILLITAEAAPKNINNNSNNDFKPVVRVRKQQQEIPELQKKLFAQLIQDGRKLLQQEMDYEGAINKFKEAQNIAITREQKADAIFYLSLAYYATLEEKGEEEFETTIRQLLEIDYFRELDERSAPLKYMEFFRRIKKEYGILRIQSNPPGADVYINESKDPVGKTPVTIGAKEGIIQVRVKKGKKEKKDAIRITAGKETTTPTYILKGGSGLIYVIGGIVLAGGVGAALLGGGKGNGGGAPTPSPTPTTGSIQVNSNPTGAQVFLDGNDTGRTTNTTLTDISPGSHTIKLVKDGYYDHEESVSVTAGQTTTMNATLSEIQTGDYIFVSKWGSQGSTDGQVDEPHGIAVDNFGNVYVADTGNHRIQKFTSDGTFVVSWGSQGSGDGQFNIPIGITFDGNGNVYIVDCGNHRIQKFTSNGAFITKWGSQGSGDAQFQNPWGIVVDNAGDVYVADKSNHRIQKFTSNGAFITKWGSQGSGDSQLNEPSHLASDGAGFIYVADDSNGRIQKFTNEGIYATSWSGSGTEEGQFYGLDGVAADQVGFIYAADTHRHRIMKFSSNGEFITMWGSQGSADGQLDEPRGLAADRAGFVYVADTLNHRIQKFGPASTIQKAAKLTYSLLNNHSLNRNFRPRPSPLKSPPLNRLEAKQKLMIKKIRKNEKR